MINESKSKVLSFIKMNDENKVYFSSSDFIKFLMDRGIRKVRIDSEYSLVWVNDYIVSRIYPSDVKEMVMKELTELNKRQITDFILDRTKLFSMIFLDAVETIELKIHRDKVDESFFYFENGVVRVTKDGVSNPIPFQEFKQLIWEDHIIKRKFHPSTDKKPVFADFIGKLSNNNEQHYKRICSLVGYCLHDYKTSATARAVIINDQNVNSSPEGGSGKSLIVDAISKLRKTVYYDGKTFDPKASFAWQKVNRTVRLVFIDDAKQGFDFEDLFSVITAGFRNINRKNKDEIELTVEESPKIVISTNNVLRGFGGSFARRQHKLEIYQYFSSKRTPFDEYGHTFFTDWNEEEWAKFDAFMLTCVSNYLNAGIVECEEADYQKKELIRATSQSFVEWVEDNLERLTEPDGIGTKMARDEYLEATNQRYLSLSERRFSEYIKSYCRIYGHEYVAITHCRPRGFRIKPCN